jgi:hypothetical protein
MKQRICIIGLEPSLATEIKKNYFGPVIYHELIPKFVVNQGKLYIEKNNGVGMLSVDKVIFHGIFENDFDLITGLSIWDGPCYPNAHAMMNCRLKLPCLARALKFSKFNSSRGLISPQTSINVKQLTVAKWGNWHCGENKAKFDQGWESPEAAIIEPFFEGESVRIVSIGSTNLQIKLEGQDWLKSIHDDKAAFMDIDQELLEDTLNIKKAFGMSMIANDYIVGNDGKRHLLEVNHIPNISRFDLLKSTYLEEVIKWVNT